MWGMAGHDMCPDLRGVNGGCRPRVLVSRVLGLLTLGAPASRAAVAALQVSLYDVIPSAGVRDAVRICKDFERDSW